MTEDEREDQLDGGLRRGLLGPLPPLGPHRLGVHPKRLGDRGPKPVGLDEHADQRIDVVQPGALAEVAERLLPRGAGPDLQVHHGELLAQHRADAVDLLRHSHQGLVEPQTGLDADHQHVQRIGEGLLHFLLPRLDAGRMLT